MVFRLSSASALTTIPEEEDILSCELKPRWNGFEQHYQTQVGGGMTQSHLLEGVVRRRQQNNNDKDDLRQSKQFNIAQFFFGDVFSTDKSCTTAGSGEDLNAVLRETRLKESQ